MYLLENPGGVKIAIMRDYISDCFKTYELIASALGSACKPKPPLPHSCPKPADITANAATVEEERSPGVGEDVEVDGLKERAKVKETTALPNSVGGRVAKKRMA